MTDNESIRTVKTIIKRYPALANIIVGVMEDARRGRIRQCVHWLLTGHLIRKQRLRRWQEESGDRYIQVGGGRHFKDGNGWINGDIITGNIYLNATRRLPLPDNTLDVIFTEQFIEHLSQQDALNFLNEAWRVLKPGGIIRQSTPDLGKLIAVYEDRHDEVSLPEVVSRHLRNHRHGVFYTKANGCQFLNDMFRLWGHQFIYDAQTFREITEDVGFHKFRWVSFGQSDRDELCGLERHADEQWMENGLVMIAEAEKPA